MFLKRFYLTFAVIISFSQKGFTQHELNIVHGQIDSLVALYEALPERDTLQFKYLRKITAKYASLMDDNLYNVYAEKYYVAAQIPANKKFLPHYYSSVMKHIGYNNPDLFRERFLEGVHLFSEQRDSVKIGFLKLNKSNFVRIMESDFDGSIALVNEVIAQFKDRPESGIYLKAHLTLGMITESIGQWGNALQYLKVATASEKDCELAEAFERIGNCFLNLNELDSALLYTKKSLRLYKGLLDLDGIPSTQANLGKIYLAKGDFRTAKNYFQKTEPLYELKHTPLTANYRKIGQFYFENNELDSAHFFLQKSIARNKIEQKYYKNKPLYNFETHRLLSEIYAKRNQLDLALEQFQKFHFYKDSLNQIEANKTLESLNVQFKTKEKERTITLLSKDKELLETRNKYYASLGFGGVLLASIFWSFFWNGRKKNQKISQQKEELAQLNTTKDQLFAIIGHDLRKPALAFRGIAKKVKFLIDQKEFDALYQLGDHIDKSAYNLNGLLDNLLNWALQQRNMFSYNPKSINIEEATEEIQQLFTQIALDKGIEIEVELENLPPVYSDENAFTTIIRNLVDNAIKFTPKGGKIKLSADELSDGVLVKVADNGVGMSPEKANQLFEGEKNQSTKGTKGESGVGIGLSLVRALVELNKGTIRVNSALNRGTTFEVFLPTSLS